MGRIISSLRKVVKFLLHSFPAKKVYPRIVTLAPSDLLKGRVALVTGGTSGIGLEIAKSFVNAGAKVIITGRKLEKLQKACSLIEKETNVKGCVFGTVMDVTNVETLRTVFYDAISKSTYGRIDVLVNNAGVLGCHLSDGKPSEFDNVISTNLRGVFFLSQIVGHYMKDNGIEGNILNIASSSSLRPAATAYTISKWGIRGLTLGLAKVLTPYGITVNGLAPGETYTPMVASGELDNGDYWLQNVPVKRYALPQEIANMAVILVSDMSRMIIGDIVYMTGGAGVLSNDDMNYEFE
jgi:NAD(P)-dependent dehydrogenase (short-subunit alcohol dehydrogenase family)